VNKKPVIVVCRNVAGRKKWIRAAVQTIATTTTSTSTTSTTVPVNAAFTDVASQTEPTLRTFTVTGKEPRTYYLNVPANYSKNTPLPLLLAFHSRTTNAQELLRSTSIGDFVNDMGFVLATIDGSVHEYSSWNAGGCCTPATDFNEDDVELSSLIIDSISSTYSIDPNRIWAIGHSNGGMMSYRLACDLSDKISGVAMVGGALMDDSCTPSKPVSLLHIHGDNDETIPFTGGGKFDVPDIQSSVIKPNSKFSCDTAPNEIAAQVRVNQIVWNCEHGAQTKLMNYLDNGHEWHLAYTKEILRFLFAHPRK
jgi:polyhydroxybutyrate depolymerase